MMRLQGPALSLVATVALTGAATGQGRYLEQDDFLRAAFPAGQPELRTLWVTNDIREVAEILLGHPFGSLRMRYWEHAGKTAWIFDEIGKERPITIGVTVQEGAIEMVRILEFRESRGWEVRYPFFTDQFNGARLINSNSDDHGVDWDVDRRIDGITGATLSVAAVTRVVRVALFLNERARALTDE